MKLIAAFKTAWQKIKGGLTAAAAFVAKEAPTVQAVVKEGSAIAVAAFPTLALPITAFDSIEESVMAEISAAISTGAALTQSSGATTVTLSAELSTIIKSLVQTMEGHPAVAAASVPAASA